MFFSICCHSSGEHYDRAIRPFSLMAWGWGRGDSFPSIFIHTPHPPTADPRPPPHHPCSVRSRYPAWLGSRSEEQTLQRPPPGLQTRRCEGPRQRGRHYCRHSLLSSGPQSEEIHPPATPVCPSRFHRVILSEQLEERPMQP